MMERGEMEGLAEMVAEKMAATCALSPLGLSSLHVVVDLDSLLEQKEAAVSAEEYDEAARIKTLIEVEEARITRVKAKAKKGWAGVKQRALVAEVGRRWACDACGQRFDDLDEATSHEDTCGSPQGEEAQSASRRPQETGSWGRVKERHNHDRPEGRREERRDEREPRQPQETPLTPASSGKRDGKREWREKLKKLRGDGWPNREDKKRDNLVRHV